LLPSATDMTFSKKTFGHCWSATVPNKKVTIATVVVIAAVIIVTIIIVYGSQFQQLKQGSYSFSIAKFPDFSSHGMKISPTLSKQ